MQIIRRDSLCLKLGGISTVSLWRLTKDDPSFPTCIKINKRIVGWLEHEIDRWIEARAESRSLNTAHAQDDGVLRNE